MPIGTFLSLRRVVVISCTALLLGACQDSMVPKDIRPVSSKLTNQMERGGMKETSPIFIRIYKEESQFEVWKQRSNGQYALLKTYEICKWSGVLGPKIKEGDRQAPEGFYTVTPGQMNPKSSYYLSFNIGFPNKYDRAHGRTGSNLMVHGACSSAGCYSMTDEAAGEIFALARDAFKGGQRSFQIQAFPFRMTPENFAKHRGDPNMEFWKELQVGYDLFNLTKVPPTVDVCDGHYVFKDETGGATVKGPGKCPIFTGPEPVAAALMAKIASDDQKTAAAAAELDADAARLAAQKQKVAEEQAAEAAKEAERAARPTVVDRLFGRKKKEPAATPVPEPQAAAETTASVKSPAPAPAPAAKPKSDAVVAANQPAKPSAPKTPPKPVAAAPAAPAEPTVGTVVDRAFNWPDDPDVVEGAAAILPPTLGTASD
ncbi:MAG: murein L,D-transpeptidase [Bauldia sp.]|uniref:L,D-transpeptidase family protein n=1 Tax=Bauldia sp. TaxID=2575872 RepID=UPI001DDB446A|nr:murein L,D-transpeptidase [Bauldia sp.]